MNREDQIKKWLAGELSDPERREFEESDEFAEISRLLNAAKSFKAPEYDVEGEYNKLSEKVLPGTRTISITRRFDSVLRIAAIFIVALTVTYFAYDQLNSGLKGQEWIAAQDEILLPDSSTVLLNAGSEIRFSHKKWDKERNVELRGEAFFKVKEGSDFHVKTQQGKVSVLGTEFSVKDREDYYEVTCYSGRVKVSAARNTVVLEAHSAFRIIQGKQEQYEVSQKNEPEWLQGESNFSSVPLFHVVKELERQYSISVESDTYELDQLFTGSFTHKDLKLALESITIPVDLNYEIKEDKIVRIFESD